MASHLITVNLSGECEITCTESVRGRHRDEFEWICPDGDLEINFNKGGSPFANGSVFTAGAGRRTRPKAKVKNSGATGAYDYTITVQRGGRACVLDPQIIIEDTWSHHDRALELTLGIGAAALGTYLMAWGMRKLLSLKGTKGHDLGRKL